MKKSPEMQAETTYLAVLGRVLAQKRKRLGREWDQADAARRAGISRSTWSRLENGESAPDAIQLARIAKMFDTTAPEFLAEVERVCDGLRKRGVKVHMEKQKKTSVAGGIGLALLGTAALAGIAAALATDDPDEPKKEK